MNCEDWFVANKGSSIKYDTLCLGNLDPSAYHTLSHVPGTPPKKYVTHLGPPFLLGVVQKPGQKPPVQILSQLFAGVLSGRFSPGWFLSIPPFVRISYNRNLNITLNFMFHMYNKKNVVSVASHAIDPPPCHKLSHLLGPPPPLERDVLYGRP